MPCLSEPPKDARAGPAVVGRQSVELNIVDRASDSTIGRTLKKTSQPHPRQQWVIPPS